VRRMPDAWNVIRSFTQVARRPAGKTNEPVIYEGAGHGFMHAGEAPDASGPNKKARDDTG
jgi:carboxymethylenebutenolidase